MSVGLNVRSSMILTQKMIEYRNVNKFNHTTTTVLRPFVQDYQGEPVPEETLNHPPS